MSVEQILPPAPFHHQEYIDAFRIKWVYDATIPAWTKIGLVSNVPLARSNDDPLGPTNGLLSMSYKTLLDGLAPKAGGFGIILKPGYYLTPDKGADSILTGNITLVSNSLKFECSQALDNNTLSTIKIGLSDDFLESYSIEVAGPKGKKGKVGPKGKPGRPGTGDGPRGDPGPDGVDATPAKFSGIIYEELDAVYNTAVVDLKLDAPNGILEITKAQLDVPTSDKPATRVAATPVIRDISFTGDTTADLWDNYFKQWSLAAPSESDTSVVVDLNIIKLPKGWTGSSTSPVPVMSIKLSRLVQGIIDYYHEQSDKIARQWDEDLKTWVIERDKAARDILHNLATQLADCQFELPLEMCIGLTPCVPPAPPVASSSSSSSSNSSSSAGGPACTDVAFASREVGKYPITSDTGMFKLWRADPIGLARPTVPCTVDLCWDGNMMYPGYQIADSEANATEVAFPVSINCNEPIRQHFLLMTNLSAENGPNAIILRGKWTPSWYTYYCSDGASPGHTAFFGLSPGNMVAGAVHVEYVCRWT